MKTRFALAVAVAALASGAFVASKPKTGCGAKCCHRPSPEADCRRIDPHTGEPRDWGDATMNGAYAVGADCVPFECVQGQGVEALP